MDTVVLSGGTDGQDGPTNAAGGYGDGQLAARCGGGDLTAGLVAATAALENNDSNTLLGSTGDLILTGLTATNVMDVQMVLIDR